MLGLEHPFRPPPRQRGTTSNSPPRRSVAALPSKPSSPKMQEISLCETKGSSPTCVVEFVAPDWQHNGSSTHVLSYEHEISSSPPRPSPFRPLSSSGYNSPPLTLPQYHQRDQDDSSSSSSSSSPPTSEQSSPTISTFSTSRSPTTQHRGDHRGSGTGSGSFPSDSPDLETLREEPEEGEATAEEGKKPRSSWT